MLTRRWSIVPITTGCVRRWTGTSPPSTDARTRSATRSLYTTIAEGVASRGGSSMSRNQECEANTIGTAGSLARTASAVEAC